MGTHSMAFEVGGAAESHNVKVVVGSRTERRKFTSKQPQTNFTISKLLRLIVKVSWSA